MYVDTMEEYKPYFTKALEIDMVAITSSFTLIETIEQLKQVFKDFSEEKVISLDFETSKLNPSSSVAGFSFSFGTHSYYVPLDHFYPPNLPLKETVLLLFDFIRGSNTSGISNIGSNDNTTVKSKRILMYNALYDLLVLYNLFSLVSINPLEIFELKILDVLFLVYNADTNVKLKSLKNSSEWYLGIKQPSFEEYVGKNLDFRNLQPSYASYYACFDACTTYLLYTKLYSMLSEEIKNILRIDNALVKPFVFFAFSDIFIDSAYAKKVGFEILEKVSRIEHEIFRFFGYNFELNSKRKLSQAFLSKGLDHGLRTKTGDLKLGKMDIIKIEHPIAQKILERNSLFSMYNAFAKKLSLLKEGKISYKLAHAPTGRIISGNRDSDYYMTLNIQNIPKSDTTLYEVSLSNEDSSDLNSTLGYSFKQAVEPKPTGSVDGSPARYVEAGEPDLNLRKCFSVPSSDYYFVSIDYDQIELRLAAYFSKEPVLYNAYLNGGDVHKATAIQIWGKEGYSSNFRRMAKTANFGLLYGGNEYILVSQLGVPLHEAREFYEMYQKNLSTLFSWKQKEVVKARRNNGVCYTSFGRPRRLGYYLFHSLPKYRGFGVRSIWSHKIQGTAADVMRIAIIRLFNKYFFKYPDVLKFFSTVHDELNFYIKKDSVDMIFDIVKDMELTVPGTVLPLPVGSKKNFH